MELLLWVLAVNFVKRGLMEVKAIENHLLVKKTLTKSHLTLFRSLYCKL